MALKDTAIVPVLAVDDLDRASAFYRDKLGLAVDRFEQDPTSAMVRVGETSWLMLYTSSFERAGTTAAAFVVPDVESAVTELRGRGVEFEEYDLPGLKTEQGIATSGGFKAAWFKDSEGNIIAVSQQQDALVRRAA
jgi:catechol 2,3-dioxygenase-like lactoylglutathione lyase family enzyme